MSVQRERYGRKRLPISTLEIAAAFVLLVAVLAGAAAGGKAQAAVAFGGQPPVRALPVTPTLQRVNPNRPVLAFYYMWYKPSTWCSCHMSDLPTVRYDSGNDATIERQITWAANAGITGFISSWWGAGSAMDTNFAKLLTHAAALQQSTGYRFDSTVYFESGTPALNSQGKIVSALRYLLARYTSNPNFFTWHGKPVIFFWDPLGQGRSLATWAAIRKQVDPQHKLFWSAEGVDVNMLSVFDGIHLFSAGYWGLLHHDMPQVDQGFRAKIDAYNRAHHTQKVWAAGVSRATTIRACRGARTRTLCRAITARPTVPAGRPRSAVAPTGSPLPPSTNGLKGQ